MRGGKSCVVVGAFAVAVGCGKASSGGLPTSGTDLSCGDSMYISNGVCAGLPPFSDTQTDASNEGSPSKDGGDAPSTPAPGPPDPLAPCAGASDVFFVRGLNQADPMTSVTYTNVDSTFQASGPAPLMVAVTRGLLGGAVASLRVLGTGGIPVSALGTPGTYDVGSRGLILGLLADSVDLGSASSGTITIDDVQIDEVDGAPGRLHSLLLWYEFVSLQGRNITGCLRYIEPSPPVGTGDAGAGPTDSSSGGGPTDSSSEAG